MRMRHACYRSLVLAALVPSVMPGQSVRGRVVEATDGKPLPGALVELRDSAGRPVQTVLTSPTGMFILSVPRGERFTVRFAAIGFVPHAPVLLVVPADGKVMPDVVMTRLVVSLKAIVAVGPKPFCGKTGLSDQTFAQLLDAARTSLQVMEATVRDQSLGFMVQTVSRQAIRKSRDSSVVSDTVVAPLVEWPIKSAGIDSLREMGFGRPMRPGEGTGRFYYGPDVGVLFSDWFFEGHCYSLDKKSDKSDSLYLKFEPRGTTKKQVDINGELVLDRATLTLHRLTFRHQDLPAGLKDGSAGGEIEFAKRPSGLWIPTRWAIWAPVVNLSRSLYRPSFGATGTGRGSVMPPPPSSQVVVTVIGRDEKRGVVIRVSGEGSH